MGDRTGLEERQQHDEEVAAQNRARQTRQGHISDPDAPEADTETVDEDEKPKPKGKSGAKSKST